MDILGSTHEASLLVNRDDSFLRYGQVQLLDDRFYVAPRLLHKLIDKFLQKLDALLTVLRRLVLV